MPKAAGLLNRAIDNLPIELHLPGYQFCGPGTHLEKRLASGEKGINPLDTACKDHDVAYSRYKDLKNRHLADNILAEKASQRANNSNAKLSERLAAWSVNKIMRTKIKLGMGMKKNPSMTAVIRQAQSALKKANPTTSKKAINIALRAARQAVGKTRSAIKLPRVIPIAKRGGILPFLIPLFAGLSAVGGLAGGAAGIAKAVNEASNATKQLQENQRHNKTIEAIALGKQGRGLHLAPYKKGWGLYLHPYVKKN